MLSSLLTLIYGPHAVLPLLSLHPSILLSKTKVTGTPGSQMGPVSKGALCSEDKPERSPDGTRENKAMCISGLGLCVWTRQACGLEMAGKSRNFNQVGTSTHSNQSPDSAWD